MPEAHVELVGLSKRFGSVAAVSEVSLAAPEGQVTTLLGPSGCGKTTLLRLIAGFMQPDAGEIRIKGRRVNEIPPQRRSTVVVFQDYALFPHLTVFENVAYGLRRRGLKGAEVTRRVEQMLSFLGLAGLDRMSPLQLSGGQQQRVALARALAVEPDVLLLDEPLSNLDATLRDEMRTELKRLQQQVGITTIYVTHDQSEALEMSDLVAVIDKGNIVQMGPPRDIYNRPASAFVAGFVGATNLMHAKVLREADPAGMGAVIIEGTQEIACTFQQPLATGDDIAVSIRPEAVELKPAGTPARPGLNRLNGTVLLGGFLGNMVRYSVKVGERTLQINASPETAFEIGCDVVLEFPGTAALGLPWERAKLA
jgi:iron(III) transport system ATP-binding protein